MLAPDEVEMTGVLVRIDEEWTFQFELDDGTCVRAEQTWATKEEAEKWMRAYVEQSGGHYHSKQ